MGLTYAAAHLVCSSDLLQSQARLDQTLLPHPVCASTHTLVRCNTFARLQKVIGRGEPVEGPAGPIVVCTRNNDLQGVLDSTPEDRREGARNSNQAPPCNPSRKRPSCPGRSPLGLFLDCCRSGVYSKWYAATLAGCKKSGQQHSGVSEYKACTDSSLANLVILDATSWQA